MLPWIEMALCGRGAQIAMVNLALEILIREHILNLFLISNTNLSVKFHVVEPLLLLLVDLETQTKNKEYLLRKNHLALKLVNTLIIKHLLKIQMNTGPSHIKKVDSQE